MAYRLIFASILCICALGNAGPRVQTAGGGDCCTAVSVKGQSAQVVEYERGKVREGDGSRTVLLSLWNNTTCPIMIPTAGMRLTKLPNGGRTFDIQDGAEIEIYYEVEDKKERGPVEPGDFSLGDQIMASRLPAGRSLVFRVSAAQITGGHRIRVPFQYEWEEEPIPAIGLVMHYVLFSYRGDKDAR